jgi:hypothetical protein
MYSHMAESICEFVEASLKSGRKSRMMDKKWCMLIKSPALYPIIVEGEIDQSPYL